MSIYIKNVYLLDFQIKRILVIGEYQDTSCLMLFHPFTQDTRAPPSDGPITQSAQADAAAGVLLCCVEITCTPSLQWRRPPGQLLYRAVIHSPIFMGWVAAP